MLFGSPNNIEWRKQVATGKLIGPRIVVGRPLVDGPNPVWKNSIAIATASEGRRAVRKVRKEAYDFVKVYSLLSRDAYFAVADEANKQGIPPLRCVIWHYFPIQSHRDPVEAQAIVSSPVLPAMAVAGGSQESGLYSNN